MLSVSSRSGPAGGAALATDRVTTEPDRTLTRATRFTGVTDDEGAEDGGATARDEDDVNEEDEGDEDDVDDGHEPLESAAFVTTCGGMSVSVAVSPRFGAAGVVLMARNRRAEIQMGCGAV